MKKLKISQHRPLPQFDDAARLRVGRGKARLLLRRANAQQNGSGIQPCQRCDLRDIKAKKRVCLRRLASRQFRQMAKWILNALIDRMYRLKKMRVERETTKEYVHRSIASSVRVILNETGTGSCELGQGPCNGLDSLD